MCKGRGFSHENGERGLVGFFIDRAQFDDRDLAAMAGGTPPVFREGRKPAIGQRPKPLARRTILDGDCEELPACESDLGMS